ncbi:hypothetical protein TYRP_013366 [Tyrophagus putrescentiae]|nr:hypothetical protein TYRP_013366 [Tyrophagus putrescentiae]
MAEKGWATRTRTRTTITEEGAAVWRLKGGHRRPLLLLLLLHQRRRQSEEVRRRLLQRAGGLNHQRDVVSSSPTWRTYTEVRCFRSRFSSHTSKSPRQRLMTPRTPASSSVSRMAASLASSFGSTPPPGTIQWSVMRLLVTRRI